MMNYEDYQRLEIAFGNLVAEFINAPKSKRKFLAQVIKEMGKKLGDC